jgi:hypothetical protein
VIGVSQSGEGEDINRVLENARIRRLHDRHYQRAGIVMVKLVDERCSCTVAMSVPSPLRRRSPDR